MDTDLPSSTSNTSTEEKKILISDIEINNENMALTVMVGILNLVQKRGGLTMEESAKVWECVSFFKSKSPPTETPPTETPPTESSPTESS